jgi:hypothetical protein
LPPTTLIGWIPRWIQSSPSQPLTAFAKIETWNSPLHAHSIQCLGYHSHPAGELDLAAFKKAEEYLAQGKMIAVAPEGTRSKMAV